MAKIDLSRRLVPDELWELTAPLLPRSTSRPQGGGTAPVDERAAFATVVYVLMSGCAWRYLADSFGVSPANAHRRFTAWTEAGLWRRLHRAELDELGARGEVDGTSAIVDAGEKGGSLTGPNPVDRGKKGSKNYTCCPSPRGCRWRSRCPVRTCTTARRSSR
ncbi:transposase [Streptomyces celluloflavus]|uniref:transposase n=1 Tax=Streptomyces celluloflavus TaxID=58344 RepID=UPI0036810421